MIPFPPLVGCGLLLSTPVGVIHTSRSYPNIPEADELYDGKSQAVVEWLVLRGGSCAWQATERFGAGGWTHGIPSQLCLQLLTGLHHTNRKWDINVLYLLVINIVSLQTNQRVHLNIKTINESVLLTSAFCCY
jgi:hypothetical protein